ncbi:uncharacterized protein LOC132623856 isoform X2 [Lycium barbarum]|uniref:uncharacterized protein LOC132623856 isoform X2 n=1 Tax=Lycium barbarum TaxID=112863 RepID=UPI00293ED83F|nr:uncharacterized protein LOC132623856 isoform X2 [Lycium barbarum]
MNISAVAVTRPSCSHHRVNGLMQQGRIRRGIQRNGVLFSSKRQLHESETSRQKYPIFTIKAQQTYDSQITILADMPLFESPHASFDRYMEDKPRVFKVIFPENRGIQRLNETKWDLEGLTEGRNKPSEFRLTMEGVLYPDRKGTRSRIKGHFNMSLSFAPPPMLALIPPHVHRDVTQSVMKNIAESMEHNVRNNLLADYAKFKKESPKNLSPP